MGWKWRTREFKLVDYLGWLDIVVGTDMATEKLLPLKELLMSVIYTVPEASEQRNKKPKPQKINQRNSLPPKKKKTGHMCPIDLDIHGPHQEKELWEEKIIQVNFIEKQRCEDLS